MASWQAYLLTEFLKFQVKRKLRGDVDVLKARATLGTSAPKVPAGMTASPGVVGGIAGEWMRPAAGSGPTLLYLHGGGYFACSPVSHRPITTAFASRGMTVFSPDYRLAPEHPFPAAIDDAVAAYRGLVAMGIDPAQLVVAGDSAGGGLALAMLLSLRDAGEVLPAAVMLMSPWTDLAATGASVQRNIRREAMFPAEAMARAAEPYLGGTDPRNPLASPLYASLHGLPPMLIHVGSYEVLLDDSTRLAERTRAAGGSVRLRSWPVVPHVWQMFPFLPETRQSLDEAADFLRAAVVPARAKAA